MSAVKAPKKAFRVEVERQHRAVLDALDKLYKYEVPARAGKPALRLVRPGGDVDPYPAAAELRAFIVERGVALWAYGGELELFGAMRAVMAARPYRQKWNRTVLSTLWADIGMPERNLA
jgi:hypothetical protein